MNWGIADKNLTSTQMSNLIKLFVGNGITSFDLADIYGEYTTEASFGKALEKSKIDRSKVQLISKCGIQYINKDRGNKVKHYQYDKDYIIWSVDNSLKNLRTDYLDIFLLHRPSPLMVADEIAQAVDILKSSGKIKNFGVSNFTPLQTELIGQKTQVDYNQIQFSATHFEPMLDGSLDYMQIHNIRPMAWNPLGVVFRENTLQAIRLKNLLATLVSKYEVGADTILLAWILKHPANIIPIAGTINTARIQNLKKATTLELEHQDWFAIWIESQGHKVP